jgi:hypothetical protein
VARLGAKYAPTPFAPELNPFPTQDSIAVAIRALAQA